VTLDHCQDFVKKSRSQTTAAIVALVAGESGPIRW
jgi:hypothetical protein